MKQNLIVAFLLLAYLPAFGSSSVCAGERLYVSHVRVDSGPPPMEGTLTGTHVILFDRKVLLKYDTYEGLSVQGVPPYRMRHEGEKKLLEESTSSAQHSQTFIVQAILEKVNSLTQEVEKEVGREQVVCRSIQNFVP